MHSGSMGKFLLVLVIIGATAFQANSSPIKKKTACAYMPPPTSNSQQMIASETVGFANGAGTGSMSESSRSGSKFLGGAVVNVDNRKTIIKGAQMSSNERFGAMGMVGTPGMPGGPPVNGPGGGQFGSNGMPLDSNGLPLDSNGLPLGSNGLPLGSNGLPLGSNGLPLGSNGLPLPGGGQTSFAKQSTVFGGVVHNTPQQKPSMSQLMPSMGMLTDAMSMLPTAALGIIGIKGLMGSPGPVFDQFADGIDKILEGSINCLTSPFLISGQVIDGNIALPILSPNIFPGTSDSAITRGVGNSIASPFMFPHAMLASAGLIKSGILTLALSPLAISGGIMLGHGIEQTVNGGLLTRVGNSPSTMSAIISTSLHQLFIGGIGLITSPCTVLSGYSPITLPGSADQGSMGVFSSPLDLSKVMSTNTALVVAGITGLLSSPITTCGDVMTPVGQNVADMNELTKKLETLGIPIAIGKMMAMTIGVPANLGMHFVQAFAAPVNVFAQLAGINVAGFGDHPPIFPAKFPKEEIVQGDMACNEK